MKITIVGAGYVGLVSGACLADLGSAVCCVESNPKRLAALRRGVVPIYEPGLEEMVARNVAAGRLSFSGELAPEVPASDMVFLAVGTPTRAEDGETDLSYVHAAVGAIAEAAHDGLIIVTKSTVPVSTGSEIERNIRRLRPGLRFAVVSNPEFLREGTAIVDFMKPDRVVIGAEDDWAGDRVAMLYAPLAERGVPVIRTRRSSAEVIKYAANAFLAVKISFVNEMSDFCEATGADISEVAHAIGLDPRIGRQFLRPGPGYGGSCLPKDGRAILQSAAKRSVKLRVIAGAVAANEARKQAMAGRVAAALGGEPQGKRVAVLGLAFKPDTDDIRESPALALVPLLQKAGAAVAVFDPKGMEAAAAVLSGVEWSADAYACAEGADAVVLATEWPEFVELDFPRLAAAMRGRSFVDLRNAVPRERLAAAGLTRFGIGDSR
ncbi:MAG: UDP-glucose/GDP-mannose dehydrogenase family protein, partial [Rhizobiales bacterium]|nr:UDP-glucose/GDP-mannose dehydrogenase family protein [Hyphomicrobiales bacterium]